jgi:hypothetical protein
VPLALTFQPKIPIIPATFGKETIAMSAIQLDLDEEIAVLMTPTPVVSNASPLIALEQIGKS